MKISRNELKELIKECLVEVLAEGLGGNLQEAIAHVPAVKGVSRVRGRSQQAPQHLRGSHVQMGGRQPTDSLKRAIEQSSGGNKVLSELLSDTANRTLPQHLQHDRPGAMFQPTDPASRAVAESDPAELFGQKTASMWEQLAFMPKRPGTE